jgi:GLPGLI family protein
MAVFSKYSNHAATNSSDPQNIIPKHALNALLRDGLVSFQQLIGNPKNVFNTRLEQFIHKQYEQNSIEIFESVGVDHFRYSMSAIFHWEITGDTADISGYKCSKATTTYAGRQYEAWFTTEIPISDGPYVFAGLPGLIVKVNDTLNHYSFTLEQFGKYTGPILKEPSSQQIPIQTTRSEVFKLREQMRINPINMLPSHTIHGADLEAVNRRIKANNNPIELK